jgi:16S rRNA (cytidine1402-2'-O)-methyltransferase
MLFIVATPIGNLGDIGARAIETLRSVDVIASEDTRRTGLLLQKLGIEKKRQISFREQTERRAGQRILAHLENGESVALVSDAGTPGISDPGFTLVRDALARGIEVTTVPGPSAFVAALVLSGLPVHSLTFRGFPPTKPGPRQRFLAVDRESPHTLIFYESPHRLVRFLVDALAVYGDRPAAVANDLTKLYERVFRGTLSELIGVCEAMPIKGEFVVVIAGRDARPHQGEGDES